MWSLAIAVWGCCGLSQVPLFLADLLRQNPEAVHERLRDL